MSPSSTTVGFYPRERFAAAAEALESIVRHTRAPYRLVIVDAATPDRYLAQMREAVKGVEDVQWITADRFLNSNESRNLITKATESEYVCFIENACLVEDGWLNALVEACEAYPAGAATPYLMERTMTGRVPHHDPGFSDIRVFEKDGKVVRECSNDLALRRERFAASEVRAVRTAEAHCQFFSRAALEALGPFDEALTVGTHLDVSCALLDKGITLVQVPASVVTHLPTTSLEPEERALFRFRWDVARAKSSCEALRRRWNLVWMPNFADFAKGQVYRVHPLLWNAYRLVRLPKSLKERYGARM